MRSTLAAPKQRPCGGAVHSAVPCAQAPSPPRRFDYQRGTGKFVEMTGGFVGSFPRSYPIPEPACRTSSQRSRTGEVAQAASGSFKSVSPGAAHTTPMHRDRSHSIPTGLMFASPRDRKRSCNRSKPIGTLATSDISPVSATVTSSAHVPLNLPEMATVVVRIARSVSVGIGFRGHRCVNAEN